MLEQSQVVTAGREPCAKTTTTATTSAASESCVVVVFLVLYGFILKY